MSDTPRTDDLEAGAKGLSAETREALAWKHARELERDLQHQQSLRREACMALEDKQLCREGLWYCSVGEKMARRIDELETEAGTF